MERNKFNIQVYTNNNNNDNNYIWHGYYFKTRWINENRFGIKITIYGNKKWI
jgi:hypothetical protein